VENKWLTKLTNLPVVKSTVSISREIRPPGFEGLSLYNVTRFFWEGLQKGAVTTRSAAIAFRIFLSIFPAIIVLLSLIPLVPIENFQDDLFDSISGFFPGDTFDLFESTLDDLLNKTHTSLISVGFILALFFASNTVNAILLGFNGSYNLERKGNPLILRLLSIVLLLVLTLILVIAASIIAFNEYLFDYIRTLELVSEFWVIFGLQVAKWVIVTFLIYTSTTVLYNVGDLSRSLWKVFSAGASFATLFFILGSIGFALFVEYFAQYNKLYGSIGTFLVLLIWMNFNCTILLLGFELNASISAAKKDKKKEN
jgi:membrane protein